MPPALKTTPAAIPKDTPPPITLPKALPTDPTVVKDATVLTDTAIVKDPTTAQSGPTNVPVDSTTQFQMNTQLDQLINQVISQDLSNAGLEQTLQRTGLNSMGTGLNSIGTGLNSMDTGLSSMGTGLDSVLGTGLNSMRRTDFNSLASGINAIKPADKTIASMSRNGLKNLISEILKEFFSKQNVNQPTTGLNEPTIDSGLMAGTMAQAVIEAQALKNKQQGISKNQQNPDTFNQLSNQAGRRLFINLYLNSYRSPGSDGKLFIKMDSF